MSFRTHIIHSSFLNHHLQEEKSYQSLTAAKGVILDIVTDFEEEDLPIAFQLDVSECVSLFILSNTSMDIVTNGAAGETLLMKANKPYQWDSQSPEPLFFLTDIWDITYSKLGANTGTLRVIALVDPTP